MSVENIAGNIFSMAELAKANGIKVVICSVLPATRYSWRPTVQNTCRSDYSIKQATAKVCSKE